MYIYTHNVHMYTYNIQVLTKTKNDLKGAIKK